MPSPLTDTTLLSSVHSDEEHSRIGHALYQGAIVVAILAFLISLWA